MSLLDQSFSVLDDCSVSRKKRCTKGTRDYKCGCGKDYLSYPALYTHVKYKHQGIFPEGTVTNKENMKQNDNIYYKLSQKRFMRDFKDYLYKSNRQRSNKKKLSYLNNLNFLFEETHIEDKEFQDNYEEVRNIQKNNPQKFQDMKSHGKLNEYQILGVFLDFVGQEASEKLHEEYFILIHLILQYFIEDDNFQDKRGQSFLNGVQENLNEFLLQGFHKYFCIYYKKTDYKFEYLGINKKKSKNVMMMIYFLGNWLYFADYCNNQLEFKFEVQLYQLIILQQFLYHNLQIIILALDLILHQLHLNLQNLHSLMLPLHLPSQDFSIKDVEHLYSFSQYDLLLLQKTLIFYFKKVFLVLFYQQSLISIFFFIKPINSSLGSVIIFCLFQHLYVYCKVFFEVQLIRY